jgi:glycine betaine/proline transport system permease protein/glycine betaine/proline transport system substrate-binding protein
MKTKVVFGDSGWDSMRFHNAVAMYIGKVAYNLAPEEVSGTTAITYTALKSGDIDVFMETWTDSLATYKDDLAKGDIKELSINYDDNTQGFYVPRYVIEGDSSRGIAPMAPDLKSVEDLKKYSNIFSDPDDTSKGRLYGAISGWEVDKVMRNKYNYYGLDQFYNYMDPGSDSALAAAISSAYEKGKPIVAYYWEPTWITGKYDLVLLEDAPYDEAVYAQGQCEFPSMKVTVAVNSKLEKTAPDFYEFLSHYRTSSELTAEALSHIQETKASYEDTAIWFLKQHDDLVGKWLPADKAELVRKALSHV